MFRKPTILTLAAAASLGVLAISTTSASAFVRFGGSQRFYAARAYAPHVTFSRSFAFRRLAIVKAYPPGWWWWKHHHHWGWWGHHHRWGFGAPMYASTPGDAGTPSNASAPATSTCNCLTKTYTQDGAVVFKDVCTKEMAMNPPAADTAPQAPASLQQPQPMKQGYLQPRPQPMQ